MKYIFTIFFCFTTLIAFLFADDIATGNTFVDRATGNVQIEADSFTIDGNNKKVNAQGNVLVLQRDVKVTGSKAIYNKEGQEVTIWEDVVMTYKDAVIKCKQMLVDGKNEILYASGGVQYFFQDIKGKSEKAIFYSRREEVVLQGNSEVTQGADNIKGKEIQIFLENKKIVSVGRTRIQLSPEKFK